MKAQVRHALQTGMIVALLVLAAITVTYPFLVKGLPEGHDRPDHLQYQHFFNEQIARGDIYPRWIPGLNQGRGSVIFLAQYPLPYYVAWGIGHVIPNQWGIYTETRSQGLAIVLATVLGALFTYTWCTTFADRLSSTIASIVFITLPYFLSIELYMRVAIGEFWALAVMPLCLYFVELRTARPRTSMAGLALAFALVLVSHLFTAFLFAPVLLTYAAWRVQPGSRFSAIAKSTASLLLGAGIAGVYFVPLLAQHNYLHPEKMLLAYGARLWPLSQMFPYDASLFPIDDPRWKSLSHLSQALAIVIILLILRYCYRQRKELGRFAALLAVISILILTLTLLAGHLGAAGNVPGALPLKEFLVAERAQIFLASFLTLEAALLCFWSLQKGAIPGLANCLLLIAISSFVMMTRWSLIIWKIAHPIWNIQFPWRLNVFLAVSTAGLAALAFSELRNRSLPIRAFGVALVLIAWGVIAFLPAWRGRMRPKYLGTKSVAYERSQDYGLPSYAQVNDPLDALRVRPSSDGSPDAKISSGRGEAQISAIGVRHISLHVSCESACDVQVGQFYYPAWRAKIIPSLTEIPLRPAAPGGLMQFSLPSGGYDLLLEFSLGWSERVGVLVSLASLLFAGLILLSRERPAVPPDGGPPITVDA
jgi:hypothetical protein